MSELNIQESIAFKIGAIDAANKKKVGDNPYHENNQDHWKWMQGFSFILSQKVGVNHD